MGWFERNKELTWVEDYIWASLGWAFCEIAFRLPDFTTVWWVQGWAYSLGNFFYGLAYGRLWEENDEG